MLSNKEINTLNDFERKIGLPSGFYFKLLNDDDWSFVIKLHTLVESAIAYSLSESIKIAFIKYHDKGNINLKKVFSLLETSNKETGKLAFLKALDFPHNNYRGFILCLSQMRNKMIHNISSVGLSIKQYYSDLESTKKADFRDKMTFTITGNITFDDNSLDKNQLFELNPKVAIWYNAFQCISESYYVVKTFELMDETAIQKKKGSEIHKTLFEAWEPIISNFIKSNNT